MSKRANPMAIKTALTYEISEAAFALGKSPATIRNWVKDGLPVLSSRKTTKPNEVDQDTHYIGLEHMPRRSIALGQWETAAKVTSNKSAFERGQILFGKLRPYFHKVGIAPLDGICSTDICLTVALCHAQKLAR